MPLLTAIINLHTFPIKSLYCWLYIPQQSQDRIAERYSYIIFKKGELASGKLVFIHSSFKSEFPLHYNYIFFLSNWAYTYKTFLFNSHFVRHLSLCTGTYNLWISSTEPHSIEKNQPNLIGSEYSSNILKCSLVTIDVLLE